MTTHFDFTERVVVVTGAATGIGRATAQAFGESGAAVIVVDLDRDKGEEVAEGIEGATFIECDLTVETQVEQALTRVEEGSGRIDILVNNAGGFSTTRATENLATEEWQRTLAVNLTSVFLMTRASIPLLKRSDAGRIINLGSLAGQTAGYRTSPAYAAAKAGVHALSRVLAWELAPFGIAVNALAPSAVLTERIEALRSDEEIEATARSIPLGRYQRPEEVARWILFLASSEAGFMTGETISLNGGRFMA